MALAAPPALRPAGSQPDLEHDDSPSEPKGGGLGKTLAILAGGALLVMGLVPALFLTAVSLGGPPPADPSGAGGITNTFAGAGLSPLWVDALNKAAQAVQAIVPGCQIHASALAAIAKEETHFAASATIAANGDTSPPILSSAGARGPMQFMPATWQGYQQDGNGDGVKNIDNIYDASLGTAVMLCSQVKGSPMTSDADLSRAFFAYNHADWYVNQVLTYYHEFEATSTGGTITGAPSDAAAKAVQAALSQLGKPYQFGAQGPDSYDCSGLTMWAYHQAGINLPRTAQNQFATGTKVDRANLAPGDLVFFAGSDGTIVPGHVGIYVGNGQMIDAAHTGTVVRVEAMWSSELAGATRPAPGR